MLVACLGLAAMLGGCAGSMPSLGIPGMGGGDDADGDINVRPANYRADIVAAMHAYLNDPTGIRGAGISEPAIKPIGGAKRYIVCVRFNAKKGGGRRNEYAGSKEIAAIFVAGRFDRFNETAHEGAKEGREASREGGREQANETENAPRGPCADAVYAPFPELEKLSR
jgi:hypothetical protein